MPYKTDPFTTPPEEAEKIVVGVFPDPRHGRLTEQVILWVRPNLDYQGMFYKLTWWGDGVAYYRPATRE